MFGFTAPDVAASDAMQQEVVRIEEEIFQGLQIPYRVIDTATGDLGGPAYRKFDLEAWMPGRGEAGEYGEVTSASNCTDYQARRLGIRCKTPGEKGTQFVHTLNGTAVAVTRAMIALLENHQQADGSVNVPERAAQMGGHRSYRPAITKTHSRRAAGVSLLTSEQERPMRLTIRHGADAPRSPAGVDSR